MRIGIDIDDTICETWEYIKPVFIKHFALDETKLENKTYSRALPCTVDEYYDFCKKYIDKLMLDIPIKKDVSKYINKLKEEGNQIYFITARGNKDMNTPYETTQEYLNKNNIKYDYIYVNSSDKNEVIKNNNIDILIDNSIKHCIEAVKIGTRVIMMNHISNEKFNNYEKANNWEEIYNLIKKG